MTPQHGVLLQVELILGPSITHCTNLATAVATVVVAVDTRHTYITISGVIHA